MICTNTLIFYVISISFSHFLGGSAFHILDSGDINRYFDELAGPWYPLKAFFLFISNKFSRLVINPMKKKTKMSKLILKKRIKEEV